MLRIATKLMVATTKRPLKATNVRVSLFMPASRFCSPTCVTTPVREWLERNWVVTVTGQKTAC